MKAENNQRVRGMIGFARRAGKTVIGTELICRAMPHATLHVVLVSQSASEPTKKKLRTKAEYYSIPYVESDMDMESLGALLGKSGATAAVGISDAGFAAEIIKATLSD